MCSKLLYHASWKWNDRTVCSLFSIRCSKFQYHISINNIISVEPMNLKIFSRMLHLIERFDNLLKFFYSIRIFWKKKVYHIFIAILVKFKLAKIRPLNLRINKNNGFPLLVFSCSTFLRVFLAYFFRFVSSIYLYSTPKLAVRFWTVAWTFFPTNTGNRYISWPKTSSDNLKCNI